MKTLVQKVEGKKSRRDKLTSQCKSKMNYFEQLFLAFHELTDARSTAQLFSTQALMLK